MPDPECAARNPAEVRGDAARGRTGDKQPGFDPATAPLETDSEAGGAAMPAGRSRIVSEGQHDAHDRSNASSYANAMRDFPGAPERDGRGGPPALMAIAAVIVLLAIGAVVVLLS